MRARLSHASVLENSLPAQQPVLVPGSSTSCRFLHGLTSEPCSYTEKPSVQGGPTEIWGLDGVPRNLMV